MQNTLKKKAKGLTVEGLIAPERLPDHPVNADPVWSFHEKCCARATEDIAALVTTLGAINIYVGDAINFVQQILSLDLENRATRDIAGEISKLTAYEAFIRLTSAKLLAQTLAVNFESKRVCQRQTPATYISHFRDVIAELPVLRRP